MEYKIKKDSIEYEAGRYFVNTWGEPRLEFDGYAYGKGVAELA